MGIESTSISVQLVELDEHAFWVARIFLETFEIVAEQILGCALIAGSTKEKAWWPKACYS